MTRKLALATAPLMGFTLFALLLTAPSWAKTSPLNQTGAVVADKTTEPAAPTAALGVRQTIFLSESFESETFPPTDWDVITYNQKITRTWQALIGAEYAHTGQRGAVVLSDTEQQDERLLTPPLVVPDGKPELVFWAKVPDVSAFSGFADNVELWLVYGEPDFGPGDDIRLVRYLVKSEIEQDGVWTEIRHDLSTYQGSTVRVAWRYDAQDAGDFFLDDVRIERTESQFNPPHNYVVAPYKIETGQWMTYVLVISNTGSITGTATDIRDDFPSGISHVAGTAQLAPLGEGIVTNTFIDTGSYVRWTGVIPTATGLLITIPVQVVGAPGNLINNNVNILDPGLVHDVTLVAETQVQPAGTLFYYESFNQGPGDDWQGNGDWAWGMPLSPLDSPHSWPNAWGTNLGGVYSDGVRHVLTGTLDLTPVPLTKTVFLQWWEWFEEGSEGIDTPDAGSLAINGETVYEIALDRAAWTEHELDITSYAGQEITLTFALATSGDDSTAGGWYIDDVAAHVYTPTASFAGSWKRVNRTKVAPGGQLTYTFYITNSGYAASTQGYMRDELPPGTRVSTVTFSGQGVVTPGVDSVEWRTSDAYPMPTGTDATITVVADVTPTLDCGDVFANSTVVAETGGRGVTPLQAPAVSIYPGDVHYASQFDDDGGGGLTSGHIETPSGTVAFDVWEWGEAAANGNGPAWEGQAAHSLPRVWGTRLAGNVPPITGVYTLTLPALDLSDAFSLPLAFQWWEWYKSGDEDHIGIVLVSSGRAPTPVEVYRVQEEPVTGWRHRSVDLSAFIGHEDVRIRFVYVTDGDNQSGPGWYVDSVALHDDCPRLLVQPESMARVACQNSTIIYELDMFNWDITPTQIDLLADWPGQVPPSLILPAALTTTVPVTVIVPPGSNYHRVIVIVEGGLTSIDNIIVHITTTGTITAHWQDMAPLPEPRALHAVVAQDDALYVIGGSRDAAGNQPLSTALRYDPATDAWSEVAEMPFPLSHVDGAAVDGEIYIPGGQTTGGVYTNTTLIYNPSLDTWRAVEASAAELDPAAGYAAVAYEGQLVRLGGYLSPGLATAQVRALDPTSGNWSPMPAMQDPRADLSGGVSGGGIYVAGGLSGVAPVTTTEGYSGGAWAYGAPVPTSGDYDRWARPGDAVLGGQLYLIGGERFADTLDHSASYSPTLDAWTTPPDLPRLIQPRRDLEADVVSNTIYAIGGRDAAGEKLYAANERLVFCPICNTLLTVTFSYDWNPLDNPTEPDVIVDGQTLTFTASFVPPTATRPIEFVWNWADGTPLGMGQKVTHVFTSTDPYRSTTDDYLVVLTGSNCSGIRLATDWVKVHSTPIYSMFLDAQLIKDGEPGEDINHIVNLYNTGTRIDSYSVEIAGGLQWTPTLVLPSNGLISNLPPGPSPGTILARVHIPSDTQKGAGDSFTLTVTPHQYPSQFEQIVLVTRYPIFSFLPVILK